MSDLPKRLRATGLHTAAEAADRIEVLETALKYARRFVHPEGVDVQYIDAVLRGEITEEVCK